jgi:hypothetical protein
LTSEIKPKCFTLLDSLWIHINKFFKYIYNPYGFIQQIHVWTIWIHHMLTTNCTNDHLTSAPHSHFTDIGNRTANKIIKQYYLIGNSPNMLHALASMSSDGSEPRAPRQRAVARGRKRRALLLPRSRPLGFKRGTGGKEEGRLRKHASPAHPRPSGRPAPGSRWIPKRWQAGQLARSGNGTLGPPGFPVGGVAAGNGRSRRGRRAKGENGREFSIGCMHWSLIARFTVRHSCRSNLEVDRTVNFSQKNVYGE